MLAKGSHGRALPTFSFSIGAWFLLNGAVAIEVAVCAIVVAVAGIAWTARRRGGGEAHSVEGYRQTLNTLEGLGTRSPGAGARRPEGRPRPGDPGGPADRPGPRRAGVGRPGLDDVRRARRPGPGGVGTPPVNWAADPRRNRRLFVLAVVVLVAVVGAAVYLTGRHHPASDAAGSGTGGTTHGTSTTTSTAPKAPLRYEPVTSTASTATYTTPTTTYALTLAATTGACWVQVTTAAGKTVFAQSIPAGGTHSLTVTGTVKVNIGAPSVVAVSVDHAPVVLPTGYRGPFTMTFAPPSTSGGSSGSSAGSSGSSAGSSGSSAGSSG